MPTTFSLLLPAFRRPSSPHAWPLTLSHASRAEPSLPWGGSARTRRSSVASTVTAVLIVTAALLASGCNRRAHFADDELLVGLGGPYFLTVRDDNDPAALRAVVVGETVTASVLVEEGIFSPYARVRIEAVAEGTSYVQLRDGGRLLDELSIEVAPVGESATGDLVLLNGVEAELTVEVNGEPAGFRGLGLYHVGERPPGTVVMARLGELSARVVYR